MTHTQAERGPGHQAFSGAAVTETRAERAPQSESVRALKLKAPTWTLTNGFADTASQLLPSPKPQEVERVVSISNVWTLRHGAVR